MRSVACGRTGHLQEWAPRNAGLGLEAATTPEKGDLPVEPLKVRPAAADVRFPEACPICTSPHLTFVKSLPRRVGGFVDLFYCMACESACSPLSPPGPLTDDSGWHLSVRDRNIGWGKELFAALGSQGPLIDVGAGIGSLLSEALELGIEGIGFDTNHWACAVGRERFGLDLRAEMWTRANTPPAKIITCISVLEHVHHPRALIGDLIGAAIDMDATLFVSVPFFTRAHWPALRTDNLTAGHFFEYPHAHVTHYSPAALEKVCKELGARNVERLTVASAWSGYVVR